MISWSIIQNAKWIFRAQSTVLTPRRVLIGIYNMLVVRSAPTSLSLKLNLLFLRAVTLQTLLEILDFTFLLRSSVFTLLDTKNVQHVVLHLPVMVGLLIVTKCLSFNVDISQNTFVIKQTRFIITLVFRMRLVSFTPLNILLLVLVVMPI